MSATYHTLGKSGLRVSRLALGTMTFGTEWGWGADKVTTQRLFDMYIDAGGNLFDTADLYTNGTSEAWLGEFIKVRGMRDKAVVVTKFGYNAETGNPNAGGNGRKNILRAVEGSLRRLATDYIDIYMLHTWDLLTPVEEVLRTIDDLVRAGKVRHVGLSNTPAWYSSRAQAISELRGYEPISVLQMEHSLVERNIEFEFIPFARQAEAGIMVWSPLGSGLLSGKYKFGAGQSTVAGRLETVRGGNNPAFQKFTDRNWRVVAELERVSAELGRTMAQVALNWVANRPGVASVIIGATNVNQMGENLAALSFDLPDHLRDRLDDLTKPVPQYPYTFFGNEMRAMLSGGVIISSNLGSYRS